MAAATGAGSRSGRGWAWWLSASTTAWSTVGRSAIGSSPRWGPRWLLGCGGRWRRRRGAVLGRRDSLVVWVAVRLVHGAGHGEQREQPDAAEGHAGEHVGEPVHPQVHACEGDRGDHADGHRPDRDLALPAGAGCGQQRGEHAVDGGG